MVTINALVAADYVLIPVEAAYLPTKGLQQLIKTIGKVRCRLNPSLEILGILLTKVDRRANFSKDICDQIREVYGRNIHILKTVFQCPSGRQKRLQREEAFIITILKAL